MKQKLLIVILLLTAVILAGVAVYFAMSGRKDDRTRRNEKSKQYSVENWKTYKNEKDSFEIKHPENTVAIANDNHQESGIYSVSFYRSKDVSRDKDFGRVPKADVSTVSLVVSEEERHRSKENVDYIKLNTPNGEVKTAYYEGKAPFGYIFRVYEFEREGIYYYFRMNNYEDKPNLLSDEDFKKMVSTIKFNQAAN
ncbi:MAG: hypothetical protein U5L10_05475 [Candidatus Moranbacteria bacterium]|nr:hypothetical protein [Candidatus Moranbacteria bacterium]